MKQRKIQVFSLLVWLGLAHPISAVLPVQAAGFDSPHQPPPTEATDVKPCLIGSREGTETANSSAAAECKQKPRLLDWHLWSKTYSQGTALCRDRNGDFICLPPNAAKNLHWLPQ